MAIRVASIQAHDEETAEIASVYQVTSEVFVVNNYGLEAYFDDVDEATQYMYDKNAAIQALPFGSGII